MGVEVTTDTVALQQVVIRSAKIADEGTPEDLAALFIPSGRWQMGDALWQGREAIAEGIAGMRALGYSGPGTGTRHLMSNILVDITGDAASVASVFTLVGKKDGGTLILAVGNYLDQAERGTDGWRIVLRRITL